MLLIVFAVDLQKEVPPLREDRWPCSLLASRNSFTRTSDLDFVHQGEKSDSTPSKFTEPTYDDHGIVERLKDAPVSLQLLSGNFHYCPCPPRSFSHSRLRSHHSSSTSPHHHALSSPRHQDCWDQPGSCW